MRFNNFLVPGFGNPKSQGTPDTDETYPNFQTTGALGGKEKHPCQGSETALGLYTMSDLRHQIENLSASEKAELLDAVWESLEADALSLTDAQRAELDHRIERHGQNPSDVIP